MKNKIVYFVFALISLAVFNSCEYMFRNHLVIKMDKKTFEKEYSAWKSQNMKNYRFTYEFFNDAGPVGPVKIEIKGNETSIIKSLNDDRIIAENMTEIYEFINSTFEFIERIKNGDYDGFKIRSLTLNIKYNRQYHYPVEVNFSEGYIEDIVGGGYYTLKITEFTPIN